MKSKTPLYIGIGAIVAALIAVGIIFVPKLLNKEGDTGNGGTSQQTTASSIVGKWKYFDSAYGEFSSDYIYTFNADGTGQYDAAGTIMPFTYTTDGDALAITYEGSSAPFESTFSIDGDVLNIKDSLGSDTLYKKM